MIDIPTWQQPIPGESDKAFAAFCKYRDLGSERTLARVGQELVKSVTLLSRWSAAYEWVERVRGYDAVQAEKARKAAEADHTAKISAYQKRAAKIGSATAELTYGFLLKAGEALKGLDVEQIEIKHLPGFLRAAASIAEISLRIEAQALGVGELEKFLTEQTHDSDQDAAKDPR